MQRAAYFNQIDDQKVECYLCPHNCIISEGKRGICGVRINKEGELFSEVYGYPVAVHTDPVEKKPLYHFFPGRQILSVGTVGCNMKCFFCQNCDISQATVNGYGKIREVGIEEVVHLAKLKEKSIGVAYTYNEPSVYFEYMIDIARETRKREMKNVVVSNGFINPEPLNDLLPYADAFNIDLKAFNNNFYRKHTKSRLQPVLDSIKTVKDAGIHLEITHLIIPELNENPAEFRQMVEWISTTTGPDTPLHLSRYFPRYRASQPLTPLALLKDFREIARERLNYVYLGNVQDQESANTYCKNCRKLVIERMGYYTSAEGLGNDGKCIYCGTQIISDM